MQLKTYPARVRFPYTKHPASRLFDAEVEPGSYVYVQDESGVVWIAPDGPHMHPRVLGGAIPAAAAGEITVELGGVITEVNNYSGTFQCPPETVAQVIEALQKQGASVARNAARTYPW